MKYVGYLLGGVFAGYAAYYVVAYLYRWEWHRALMSGILLLVMEGFLVCLVLLNRMSRLQQRVEASEAQVEEVRRRLEQTRRPEPGRFRWMDGERPGGENRTYVFVPVLMMAGVVLSGAAFVIQKIAGATARPAMERRLAGRLAALAAPPEALGGSVRLEDRPAVPPARRRRTWLTVAAALAGGVVAAVLFTVLADATQTRPERRPDSAASTVVFRIEMRGAPSPQDLRLAAGDLWETCRRSTAARNERAALSRLEDTVYAGVIRPALPAHDLMRLRGCIEDATTERAAARVLGEGQAASG
ncbi:hypothetical protein AB0A60_21365 [Streptomyces sp. NPDC046275]|uniref:hypothetical protein n=1 Tax=Streptomyces sp. NPDC046275 TaxID=3157201 RepID=UPI00340FA309